MNPAAEDQDLARADTYAILARLFQAPPDAAFLEALAAAGQLCDVSAEAAQGDLPKAWAALTHATAKATPESAGREYEALFVAVGRPQVVLYASWYLTGFMMEKPLALLRDDLAALGLARRAEVLEPEDHFAALMEVMRHLISDVSRPDDQRLAKIGRAHV